MPDDLEFEVGADISEFSRKMDKVQRKIGGLADNIAGTFKQVGGELTDAFEGLDHSLPVSPLDAALKGIGGFALAGVAANSVGILAGALGGLASQLTVATAGFAAFSAVAIPTINDLFEAQEKIAEAEKAIAEADTTEERIEAKKRLQEIYDNLSESQENALDSLKEFQGFWDEFTKSFESPVLESFTKSLGIAEEMLTELKPTFEGMTETVNNLLDSFSESLDDKDMQEVIAFINEEAAPAFETLSKTAGNFLAGFLSMMEAFGPLGVDMSEGLLGLSEDFREWAATLEENKQFQDFIAYVRENGPDLLNTIQQVSDFLLEMGEQLAPIGDALLEFFGWVAEVSNTTLQAVEEQKGQQSELLTIIQSLWNQMKDEIFEVLDDIWGEVQEYFGNKIESFLGGLDYKSILWTIGSEAIEGLIGGLTSIDIPEPSFNMIGTLDLNPKGGISIPSFDFGWYADGGVFTGPSVIGVGEAGDEAVVPLSGSRMKPFAEAIASEMSGDVGSKGNASTATHITNHYKQVLPGHMELIIEGYEAKGLVRFVSDKQEQEKIRDLRAQGRVF